MAVFLRARAFDRQKILCLSLSFALLGSSLLTNAAPVAAAPAKNKAGAGEYQRLPLVATPERYDLFFEPNFDSNEFEATETAYLKITESTKQITLNSLDLSIFEASIARNEKGHGDWIKAEIERNKERETVVFKFPRALAPGKYELAIKFNGKLNQKMSGFYLSSFKDKDGKESKLVSTHMEPSDARRMFPCFDEPIYKATYHVTAAIPEDMVAISNAAVQFEKIDQRKNKKIVTFEESPKMSSYLFALVIGHLKASKPVIANGKEIRVWCTEGKEHLTEFALSSAAKFLPYYENYFGVPYPLKKLDLIGVPDFAHGAMENIGAITFRETALLVDQESGSTHAKKRVADVVAHEMAHLWFGDLVTMAWWNDLWLNEAFATWMADKAVANLKPEWRIWDDFAVMRANALTDDSINATRAVQCVVNSPSDAMEMFDEITYDKGASLLRMLEMYLSEGTFQNGIQQYMKQHAFANATTEDLWQALSQATSQSGASGKSKGGGTDVSALMHAWVHTPGCPLVSFRTDSKDKNARSDNAAGATVFSQERCLLLNQPGQKSASDNGKADLWQIPMMLRGAQAGASEISPNDLKYYILSKANDKAPLNNFVPLFLNALGNGFFRSNYDSEQLDAIWQKYKAGPAEIFQPAERISLFSDVWSAALSGKISIDQYLAFTDHFADESDPYVQTILVSQLEQLETLISDDMRPGFQSLVRKRLAPVLEKLTMSKRVDDTDLVNDLRGRLILCLGTIGQDKKIIEFCRAQFETYINDEKSIEGNLRAPVVDVVAYNGGEEEFHRIQTAYLDSKEPEARQRNLETLSYFRDKDIVAKALDYALTKEVRAQDMTKFVVGPLLSHSASKHQAWDFVKARWSDFESRLTEDQMPKLIDAVAYFASENERADISAFINTHPLPAGRRRVAKTLEFIAIRAQFKEKQSSSLAAFLKKMVVAESL